tara:strand:- start:159 stop:404 length:246 start_codon:yes stop_codon:yes gene_type:complete
MYKLYKATVPAARNHVKCKYPFPDMKPGQAFNVPGNDPAAKRNSSGGSAILSAVYSWQRRNGGKFATRRNTDDSISVYRVK